MGTHPIFESDFDCLTDKLKSANSKWNLTRTSPVPVVSNVHVTSMLHLMSAERSCPLHCQRSSVKSTMSDHSQSVRMMRLWSSVVTSRDNKPARSSRSSVRSLSFMLSVCNARRLTEPPFKLVFIHPTVSLPS